MSKYKPRFSLPFSTPWIVSFPPIGYWVLGLQDHFSLYFCKIELKKETCFISWPLPLLAHPCISNPSQAFLCLFIPFHSHCHWLGSGLHLSGLVHCNSPMDPPASRLSGFWTTLQTTTLLLLLSYSGTSNCLQDQVLTFWIPTGPTNLLIPLQEEPSTTKWPTYSPRIHLRQRFPTVACCKKLCCVQRNLLSVITY